MTESITPVNSMGTGETIATYDPRLIPQIMKRKKPKPLRSIIPSPEKEMKKELKRDKRNGI